MKLNRDQVLDTEFQKFYKNYIQTLPAPNSPKAFIKLLFHCYRAGANAERERLKERRMGE